MKLLTAFAATLLLCFALTQTSCSNGNDVVFKTKDDSLKFAKAYYQKYPGENSVTTQYRSDSAGATGFGPILWKDVLNYEAAYDKQPIIYNPAGVALQGFAIDTTGYSMIQKNPIIKGLYLRFGRKYDGSFTIMVLGTNAKGYIMTDNIAKDSTLGDGAPSNFDNIPPCPQICPTVEP